MMGKLEARIPDRRPDAVAALADGRIGKTNHREMRKAEGDVHFNVDWIGFDAKDSGTAQACEHDASVVQEMDHRPKTRNQA